jgi:hypothetical protein
MAQNTAMAERVGYIAVSIRVASQVICEYK